MSHFSVQKRNSRNSRIPAHNLRILYLQQYHTSSQYFHSRPQAQEFHLRWYLCLCCGFWAMTEELKVKECVVWAQIRRQMSLGTYLSYEKSILGCGLGWTVKNRFGLIMSNFWGPFFKVFMGKNFFFKDCRLGTEKLHRIKVNKKNWKYFLWAKTSFFMAKVLSVSTKTLWSVLCLLLLWVWDSKLNRKLLLCTRKYFCKLVYKKDSAIEKLLEIRWRSVALAFDGLAYKSEIMWKEEALVLNLIIKFCRTFGR